jgi:hypothetical protein
MRHVKAHRLAELAAGKSDARVAAHLDGCARCRTAMARVTEARMALRSAGQLEAPESSPAAQARAEASIRWTRIAPAVRVRPSLMAGFAAAAAVAALTLVATRDWSRAPADRRAMHATLTPAPGRSTQLQALVTIVGGQVQLARALKPARALDLQTALGAGDTLTTAAGARVAAQWSEGSGFLLLGDSQMTLTKLEARTQRLALERGRVSVRVGPHDLSAVPLGTASRDGTRLGSLGSPVGESLKVMTPDHVISVHGTWFTVASAAHVTTVEVLEGTVEVTERDGSSSMLLHAPARATLARGRASNAPLSVRDAARLRAESEMDLTAWPSLAAARAATGTLLVATQPPAELAIDGVAIGPTSLGLRSALGRHYVELTRAGFLPLRQWITVGPEPGELRAAMTERPKAAPDTAPVEIESMIKRRATQIRACYERRLKHDPALAGTVSLRLRVGGAGQVSKVSIEESTLPDPLVAECLRHEAAGWSFAQGRNATVVYPFVFRSQ